jgi:hypothetical protein
MKNSVAEMTANTCISFVKQTVPRQEFIFYNYSRIISSFTLKNMTTIKSRKEHNSFPKFDLHVSSNNNRSYRTHSHQWSAGQVVLLW